MKQKSLIHKLLLLSVASVFITMCTPPEQSDADADFAERARLDSIREVRCPRVFSSAAEFYKNRDWGATVRAYDELTELGCDQDDPKEVYLYYAIAYEYMGKYDSSEIVLLKGLTFLPDNVDLRKRLAYSYDKQGKSNLRMDELDRLTFLAPEDLEIKIELAKLYGEEERFDDQIAVLNAIIKINPTNEGAQSDLARAYELSGRDPLDVYKKRFDNNPDNISYGLDYAEKLLSGDRPDDAAKVLKQVVAADPSSKVAYRKLAEAYDKDDRLADAAKTYERLFRLDPRDFRVAVKIVDVYIEEQDYKSAFDWADKAVTISGEGEALGAKGNVYYKAFQACRTGEISVDDRVVATLAFNLFSDAEKSGFSRYSRSKDWLKENEVLFGKPQWFMMDATVKNRGYVKAGSSCYSWVSERLDKGKGW
ncbi:MAG: tetratricopeptide repeat protein [Candidatus Marinimicrobia bacterium]|jgi:tetratricopeptide (TPR) repeat protein|nr:tetratricopeptide repeat protein [Candidatus Neomarinimicrobiota bacterium]MBT3948178.1 tetratricopeptide repeat protein [Candidatus Neomarinimicrobiota bacterium]MBT4063665.1 tetratricopeptide repeat protein [Candidatus Neomarinimicrobiota bacterium]MBT4308700.1 tetratricopeptide repeat protein [Candidatus Neomarinimicrobiota bacterium]MBT4453221.1 tetratricopeptide repeat protein [Candidatus Neomarinimicrobiota bacterium]